MSCQVGDRAGAIFRAGDGKIELFGYGIYQGEQIPDLELNVMFMGGPMEHENPCILLDSGEKVYGCECWWAPEEQIKARVAQYTEVTIVSPAEERRKHNRPPGE
jgi:hypothetical protein